MRVRVCVNTILVCLVCHHKLQQSGLKKKQKLNVSQVWRLKAQDQGFSRIGSLLRVVKENLVYSVLLAAGGVLAIFRTLVL